MWGPKMGNTHIYFQLSSFSKQRFLKRFVRWFWCYTPFYLKQYIVKEDMHRVS